MAGIGRAQSKKSGTSDPVGLKLKQKFSYLKTNYGINYYKFNKDGDALSLNGK